MWLEKNFPNTSNGAKGGKFVDGGPGRGKNSSTKKEQNACE